MILGPKQHRSKSKKITIRAQRESWAWIILSSTRFLFQSRRSCCCCCSSCGHSSVRSIFFFFVFRLPFFFPLLDFTPSIVNVHENMVYGTKNSEWNGIHIDYVSRSPAKKKTSSTERETKKKKKVWKASLEGKWPSLQALTHRSRCIWYYIM